MSDSASHVDPAASVAAKVNRRILPLLIAGWFIAYIDRFNVSYAALQMNEELGLSSAVFGFGAGVFFLGYSVLEIPSSLVLARVGPRRWLARIMVTWGILSAAMMLTQGPWSFYLLRFLLGVAEAGCFPAMAYCLTRWLSPRDRAAALASLATMALASGVVGAPMAALLLSLDGALGLSGWQWLFLIEGLPAIAIGWAVLKYLPDGPDDAPWLSEDERAWLKSRTFEETHVPSRTAVRTVLANPRYWRWGLAFFCATAGGSAFRVFQPVIFQEVTGLGNVLSALLGAVPALAGVAAILVVGRRSTRMNERRWHAAVPMLIGASGLALVGVTYGVPGALLVASVASIGAASQPPLFASVSSVTTGATNAVGIAFVNSVAAVGAFLGPYLVGYALDATASLATVCAGAGLVMAAGAVITVTTREAAVVEPLPSQVATTA